MPNRRQPPTPERVGTPKQARLRRKVPVEEAGAEGTASRRLVEYFVVISSEPRWHDRHKSSVTSPKHKRTPSPSKKRLPKQSSRWFGRKATTSFDEDSSHHAEKEEREPQSPKRQTARQEEGGTGNIRMPQTPESEYTFQPKITARYPSTEYPDHSLNPMLVQFCYPSSDVILPSSTYVMPRIHHFVLTNDKGRKVYGTCLTVYEEYYPDRNDPFRKTANVHSDSGQVDIEVTAENEGQVLYIPRVLCLLSTWPYLTAFREYIAQLYRLATTTNLMDTPIERHILNICQEIPAPPPGSFEIQVPILTSTIRFWAPPAKLPIPYVALPYQTLFDCLDVENIVTVWYALLLERSVLLLSSQYSILTVCAEILCSMLFPMQWSHLYIPLVPRFLSPMLDAPFPYLCGVIGENWGHARQFVSEETILVNLDNNTVTYGIKSPTPPPVPSKKWEKLKDALRESAGNVYWETRGLADARRQVSSGKLKQEEFERLKEDQGEPSWKEKLRSFDNAFNLAYTPDSPNLLHDLSEKQSQSQWDKVQEAFLRFMVSTFKSYRKYLQMPEELESPKDKSTRWSQQRSFDRDGFIASQKDEYQAFLRELCGTQHFDDFITKRLYSPAEPDVIFFDQSIDAKMNRSRLKLKKVDTPFLQVAQAHKVLNVVTAVEPNNEDLPIEKGAPEGRRAYIYKTWPEKFDLHLFGTARPIPSIITAEFDRQSALVSRLRANHMLDGTDESDLMDFYGGDFDPSPEVATFTVFFFTYSAVVGREWQEYQSKRREMQVGSTVDSTEEHLHLRASHSPTTEVDRSDGPLGGTIDVASSFLDCSNSDCDICPDYNGDQGAFQQEFLARFSGSQLSQSQGGGGGGGGALSPAASLLDFDEDLAEFEEAREVAVAQLDLAFNVLTTMNLRGLPTDPDAFKSLMEACGRCGDTDRALQLMERMKKEGFVTDSELYSELMKAFAQGDGSELASPTSADGGEHKRRQSDAYASFLKKKLHFTGGTGESEVQSRISTSDEADSDTSGFTSASEDDTQNSSFVSDYLYTSLWGPRTPKTKKKKKRRRRSSLKSSKLMTTIVTDGVRKQNILGESLLDFLYPDLQIDTGSDSCPMCSKQLTKDDIVAGWLPCEFQDFTTACPQCGHRFVPRFSVKCTAPTFEGSQGRSTPLYCEMLSPWVLRKELESIIHGPDGIEGMLDPQWRSGADIRATIFWNLVVSFINYRLPVSFLLQGSFQNRLINPTPDA